MVVDKRLGVTNGFDKQLLGDGAGFLSFGFHAFVEAFHDFFLAHFAEREEDEFVDGFGRDFFVGEANAVNNELKRFQCVWIQGSIF